MSACKLKIQIDVSRITELLKEVEQADLPEESLKRFLEVFERLVDAGHLFKEVVPVDLGDSSTAAGERVVSFYPTNTLIGLFTALLAGDRDFSAIEHSHYFVNCSKTKHSKGEVQ